MKKKIFIVLVLLGIVFGLTSHRAYAFTDDIAPKITRIKLLEEEVVKPGYVTLDFDLIEEDSGVSEIWIGFWKEGAVNYTEANSFSRCEHLYTPLYSGHHKLTVYVGEKVQSGKYLLDYIHFTDSFGNQVSYNIGHEYTYGEDGSSNGQIDYFDLNGERIDPLIVNIRNEIEFDDEFAISNPNRIDRLNKLKEGGIANILVPNSNKMIVEKEIFDAIKGKDKTIVLTNGIDIQWIFNGKDIINKTKDIDICVYATLKSGLPYGLDEKVLKVEFKPNGLLPGKATIRVNNVYLFDRYNKSNDLNVYYEEDTGISRYKTTSYYKAEGASKWCVFDVTHNSTYVLSGKTLKNQPTVTLSKNSYTYDGKTKTPSVTVKAPNGTKLSSKDYNVTYASGRKNVGTYSIKVTPKGKYKNLSPVTLTFTINPKGATIKTPSKFKGGFTAKWSKQSSKMSKTRITGYQVRYSTSSSMTNAKYVNVKEYSKTSVKINNLLPKKKYYVQVRTYTIIGGKTYYSGWSKTKNVTTK